MEITKATAINCDIFTESGVVLPVFEVLQEIERLEYEKKVIEQEISQQKERIKQ